MPPPSLLSSGSARTLVGTRLAVENSISSKPVASVLSLSPCQLPRSAARAGAEDRAGATSVLGTAGDEAAGDKFGTQASSTSTSASDSWSLASADGGPTRSLKPAATVTEKQAQPLQRRPSWIRRMVGKGRRQVPPTSLAEAGAVVEASQDVVVASGTCSSSSDPYSSVPSPSSTDSGAQYQSSRLSSPGSADSRRSSPSDATASAAFQGVKAHANLPVALSPVTSGVLAPPPPLKSIQPSSLGVVPGLASRKK